MSFNVQSKVRYFILYRLIQEGANSRLLNSALPMSMHYDSQCRSATINRV